MKTSHNGKEQVGRITGLDPAGPGFDSNVPLSHRLDGSDAFLVDIIQLSLQNFRVLNMLYMFLKSVTNLQDLKMFYWICLVQIWDRSCVENLELQ